ncbi:MAG TPA: NADH-quinone oxidoreductase subunit L [Cytophagaceae bacterium]|jgi:NADH-quinone oxidoreductase subunit L|nr:NADH-quinone oxidoreductase subunit L [Cytophagaceae bacterium]
MGISNDTIPLLLILTAMLLPVLSFVGLLLAGESISESARSVTATVLVFLSFLGVLVTLVFCGVSEQLYYTVPWFEYFSSGRSITYAVSLSLNGVSLIMLSVVMFISFLVHLYSYEYMGHRKNHVMYYPYLGLFTFSMSLLVVSHNLLIIFIGWELVGFSSYLLVGFWFNKEAAAHAASKAFLINRVADVFFLGVLLLVFFHAGSFDLNRIQTVFQSGDVSETVTFSIGLLIFIGCMAKTAQFPLNSWLPDAMEGPTPVSALLHAATMVAAGVYLLVKLDFMLTADVRFVMAIVGSVTALLGALPALTSFNSKKILAFSTISQLGYMIAAIGCSASSAAFFHLITHAFFKAGLFLSVGAVIHALHKVHMKLAHEHRFVHMDPLDMRIMGGMSRKMPLVFAAYLITASSLIGLPLFSGFLSKESILNAMIVFAEHYQGVAWLVPSLGIITVFVTAYYVARQGIWIFSGESRLNELKYYTETVWVKVKVNQPVVVVPLILLSISSFFFCFSVHPLHAASAWLYGLSGLPAYVAQEQVFVVILSLVLVVSGISLAYWMTWKSISVHAVEKKNNILTRFYYLDDAITGLIVNPVLKTGKLVAALDKKGLDGIVHGIVYIVVIKAHVIAWIDRVFVDGVISLMVYSTGKFGKAFRVIQRGNVQNYLFWVLVVMLLVVMGELVKEYLL